MVAGRRRPGRCRPGPDVNVNPIYVVPVADSAIICVDRNGDGTFDNIDTDGNGTADAGNADYTADGTIDPGCYAPTSSPRRAASRFSTRSTATTPAPASSPRCRSPRPTARTRASRRAAPRPSSTSATTCSRPTALPRARGHVEASTDASTVFESGGTFSFRAEVDTFLFAPFTGVAIRARLPANLVYTPGSSVFTPPVGGPAAIADPALVGPDLVWTGACNPRHADRPGGDPHVQRRHRRHRPNGRYDVDARRRRQLRRPRFKAQQCVTVFKTTVQLGKLADRMTAAAGDSSPTPSSSSTRRRTGPDSIERSTT